MALTHSPTITKTGLIFHYDAANVKSYPGTGTTITDMEAGLTGSASSVSFVDENQGFLRFSTSSGNQFDFTSFPHPVYSITIEAAVRVAAHAGVGQFHNFVRNNWVNNGWILYSSSSNWVFGIGQNGTQYNSAVAHANSLEWVHLVGRYDGSQVRLFINSIPVNSIPNISNAALNTNTTLSLGANSRPASFDIALFRYYNRALTDNEIKQNFSAVRGRYQL